MLVSGGADWTVRCWDVKSSGGQVKSRENVMNEGSTLRNDDDENSETCVPKSIVSIIARWVPISAVPTCWQLSPRKELP